MLFSDNITQILNAMESKIGDEAIEALKMSRYDELNSFHFGIGAYIRNEFLVKGTPLYEIFKDMGVFTADEMSSILIRCLYFHLKTK